MRIFISHKFQKEDKKKLKEKLKKIIDWLESQGFQTFCYLRDKEKWRPKKFPPGKVIKEAFKEIKNCDAVLTFVDSKKESIGIYLEFGFAKALKKKIILLISEKVSLPILEAVSDKVIKFKSLKELNKIKLSFN